MFVILNFKMLSTGMWNLPVLVPVCSTGYYLAWEFSFLFSPIYFHIFFNFSPITLFLYQSALSSILHCMLSLLFCFTLRKERTTANCSKGKHFNCWTLTGNVIVRQSKEIVTSFLSFSLLQKDCHLKEPPTSLRFWSPETLQ